MYTPHPVEDIQYMYKSRGKILSGHFLPLQKKVSQAQQNFFFKLPYTKANSQQRLTAQLYQSI